MTLSDLIKQHRPGTQAQLAMDVGVTPSFISQLESGHRQPKKHTFILALSKALNVSSDTTYAAMNTAPPDLIDALTHIEHVRTVRLALGIPTPEEPS